MAIGQQWLSALLNVSARTLHRLPRPSQWRRCSSCHNTLTTRQHSDCAYLRKNSRNPRSKSWSVSRDPGIISYRIANISDVFFSLNSALNKLLHWDMLQNVSLRPSVRSKNVVKIQKNDPGSEDPRKNSDPLQKLIDRFDSRSSKCVNDNVKQ